MMNRKNSRSSEPADIDSPEIVEKRVAVFAKIRDVPFCFDYHKNYTKSFIATSISTGKPCGCGIKSIALADCLPR